MPKLYKELRLNGKRGLIVKLDPEDYKVFSQENWNSSGCGKAGVYYASKMKNLGRINGRAKYRKRTMHREILEAKHGEIVDHINGDTLDNRRDNLRIVTLNQSMQNRRGWEKKTLKGVYKIGNKWESKIQANGISYYLGRFNSAELARVAYVGATEVLHGEFRRES